MSYTKQLQCLVCHSWFLKKKSTSKYCSAKCFHTSRKGSQPWNVGKTFPYKSRPGAIGRTVWNKGKKGVMPIPWNKGKRLPYKVWNKGKKGIMPPPWNKGKKLSLELCRKFSENQRGKKIIATRRNNHWNWKGGISPLRKKVQELEQYKQWRRTIFIRDNWKCIICKKHGGRLVVDHFPISYGEIQKRYYLRSVDDARKCKLLWKISNGRTLCEDCHKKTETYGAKNLYLLKNENNRVNSWKLLRDNHEPSQELTSLEGATTRW